MVPVLIWRGRILCPGIDSNQATRQSIDIHTILLRMLTPWFRSPAGFPSTAASALDDATAFKPPPGFDLLARKSKTSPTHSSIIRTDRQHQLWLMTAPAHFLFSELQRLQLDRSTGQISTAFFKGASFSFNEASNVQADRRHLLITDSKSNSYKPLPSERTFEIHQSIVSSDDTVRPLDSSSAQSARTRRKEQPQHPEGLRMRYIPFGVPEANLEYELMQQEATWDGRSHSATDAGRKLQKERAKITARNMQPLGTPSDDSKSRSGYHSMATTSPGKHGTKKHGKKDVVDAKEVGQRRPNKRVKMGKQG